MHQSAGTAVAGYRPLQCLVTSITYVSPFLHLLLRLYVFTSPATSVRMYVPIVVIHLYVCTSAGLHTIQACVFQIKPARHTSKKKKLVLEVMLYNDEYGVFQMTLWETKAKIFLQNIQVRGCQSVVISNCQTFLWTHN